MTMTMTMNLVIQTTPEAGFDLSETGSDHWQDRRSFGCWDKDVTKVVKTEGRFFLFRAAPDVGEPILKNIEGTAKVRTIQITGEAGEWRTVAEIASESTRYTPLKF